MNLLSHALELGGGLLLGGYGVVLGLYVIVLGVRGLDRLWWRLRGRA